MLYVIVAVAAVVVLLVVGCVVRWRRLYQEKRKTFRYVIDSRTNPAFSADDTVSYRDQHTPTTTRTSVQPPHPRQVTILDRPTAGSPSLTAGRYCDDGDASRFTPRQALYSGTVPGRHASGHSCAVPPQANVYENLVPAFADAHDYPPRLQCRNGVAAVKIDMDLYVLDGFTAQDDASLYEMPTLLSA
jgi:hypothetical protein